MKFRTKNTSNIWAIIGIIILVLAIAFGLMCLEAWIIMLLWNAIVTKIIVGVCALTFWQTCGLVILIDLLFGTIKATTYRSTER